MCLSILPTLELSFLGGGKITPERISRLEAAGFEWDPQRAQWNTMVGRLSEFQKDFGHCKVPKGYAADPELANWVRNQRLEQVNRSKGKKTRMTQERYDKLSSMGFQWSGHAAKGRSPAAVQHVPKAGKEEGDGKEPSEEGVPKTETDAVAEV